MKNKLILFATIVTALILGVATASAQEAASQTEAPVKAALQKAEKTWKGTWKPEPGDQQEFFQMFWETDLSVFDPSELRSAAGTIPEINRFLKAEGFDLQLQEQDPGDDAVAAVLKVAISWQKPGSATKLTLVNGTTVDAVSMNAGFQVFEGIGKTPIVRIASTRANEWVYLIPYESRAGYGAQAQHVAKTLVPDESGYEKVLFPMIDMDVREDISPLLGMRMLVGNREVARISQAIQQTRLKMDEKGASVESAAAVARSKGLSFSKTLSFDKTQFGVVVTRDNAAGKPVVVFTGRMTPKVMKDPKK